MEGGREEGIVDEIVVMNVEDELAQIAWLDRLLLVFAFVNSA